MSLAVFTNPEMPQIPFYCSAAVAYISYNAVVYVSLHVLLQYSDIVEDDCTAIYFEFIFILHIIVRYLVF